jgi:hypothetical protein
MTQQIIDFLIFLFKFNFNKPLNEIAQFIDHTLLKATAAEADIVQLCEEATNIISMQFV